MENFNITVIAKSEEFTRKIIKYIKQLKRKKYINNITTHELKNDELNFITHYVTRHIHHLLICNIDDYKKLYLKDNDKRMLQPHISLFLYNKNKITLNEILYFLLKGKITNKFMSKSKPMITYENFFDTPEYMYNDKYNINYTSPLFHNNAITNTTNTTNTINTTNITNNNSKLDPDFVAYIKKRANKEGGGSLNQLHIYINLVEESNNTQKKTINQVNLTQNETNPIQEKINKIKEKYDILIMSMNPNFLNLIQDILFNNKKKKHPNRETMKKRLRKIKPMKTLKRLQNMKPMKTLRNMKPMKTLRNIKIKNPLKTLKQFRHRKFKNPRNTKRNNSQKINSQATPNNQLSLAWNGYGNQLFHGNKTHKTRKV
jgi:hypothetical protein